MDLARIVVTAGGVGLIIGTLWFFFGKRGGGPASERQEKGPRGGEKIYSCPMHPWITSTDPTATCSICEMKLVLNEKASR